MKERNVCIDWYGSLITQGQTIPSDLKTNYLIIIPRGGYTLTKLIAKNP